MNSVTQFDKFIGEKVLVNKSTETYKFLGRDRETTVYKIEDGQSVIEILTKEVKDAGFQLRIWLPMSLGTMDFRTDRVNVHIDEKSGTFQITGINIG